MPYLPYRTKSHEDLSENRTEIRFAKPPHYFQKWTVSAVLRGARQRKPNEKFQHSGKLQLFKLSGVVKVFPVNSLSLTRKWTTHGAAWWQNGISNWSRDISESYAYMSRHWGDDLRPIWDLTSSSGGIGLVDFLAIKRGLRGETFTTALTGPNCMMWNPSLQIPTPVFKQYSTVGCRRTVCRRTARLEFHLRIRTTPGWKNELRTVSPHANSVSCEDDFFGGIADFDTTPLQQFETFQRPRKFPARHASSRTAPATS